MRMFLPLAAMAIVAVGSTPVRALTPAVRETIQPPPVRIVCVPPASPHGAGVRPRCRPVPVDPPAPLLDCCARDPARDGPPAAKEFPPNAR